MMRTLSVFFVLFALSPAAAQAPGSIRLDTFQDWSAAILQADGKLCVAYTQPRESEPRAIKRDASPFFYVSRRPGRTGKTEVSVRIGYPFRDKSTPTLTISEQTFDMFARNDVAWLVNQDDTDRLIEIMRKGQEIVVKGVSQRGTRTTDTFSLAGMPKALDRALKDCR